MIPKKLLKTVRAAYLYPDGHAVLVHEDRHPKAGVVEWVTLHESIGLQRVHFEDDQGRLVLGSFQAGAALAMLSKCAGLRCRAASPSRGSQHTKDRNLSVGSVSFDFGFGYVSFSTLPDLLSEALTYQPSANPETWAEVVSARRWGDYNVASVFIKAVPKTALPGETTPCDLATQSASPL